MQDLNHKHFIATASGLRNAPRTAEDIEIWLADLVEKVGMIVLMGPYGIRCETIGNEGVTGIVCIETSHASIHVWDTGTVPFLKCDLYSCKDFDPEVVLDLIRLFDPIEIEFMVIDRNDKISVIQHDKYVAALGN